MIRVPTPDSSATAVSLKTGSSGKHAASEHPACVLPRGRPFRTSNRWPYNSELGRAYRRVNPCPPRLSRCKSWSSTTTRIWPQTIAESLERRGHECTVATSGKAGAARIDDGQFDVVLTDLRMADIDGLAIVEKVREKLPEAEVFVITGFADVKTAVEAMKRGASHYLQKPIDLAELRAVVDKSAEQFQKVRDLRRQLEEKFGFEGVVGNSPKMQRVLQLLKAYAPTVASVLVLGENGTGKELAARALHANSPRKAKPFVAMNCAALNENLLDDEMFGHEDGAFTGAQRPAQGPVRIRPWRHALPRRSRRHAAGPAGQAAPRAG